ncbi:MAG TPA: protein kinase [Polyangiaceae bacterium]|nr:protein kinase [Polyangiaceae bacterium]
MRDQGLDRYVAPWERLRATFDPEADKPTLVQTPDELLATERAPRTLPARQVSESLLDLEQRLNDAAKLDAFRAGSHTRFDVGTGRGDADAIARSDGELEAAYDDAWSPNPRSNELSHLGQVIDNRYIVESLIARGGMGIVYRCRHKLIDRRFAVKIIRSTMAHLPDAPRRFLMEAKAASSIGNEHIIDVVDYGTLADGSAYLVMELLEGVPLSDVIAKHETLPVGRITAIAAQMCEGLRAAHDAGIVHRDLKPENIFLTNRKAADFVKILDFGIAKMARSGEPLTKKGLIVGTPHYMSPEQAAGAPVDARGDIYSLGVILYELATGRVPFDAAHYMAVLAKHMTEAPPPFETLSLQVKLPSDFESIVLRCLAKRPEQRYQTMTDVMAELEKLAIRLRSPSRPSIDVMLPLAPVLANDDVGRSSGGSVPAAPGRSVLAQPKRRSFGLLLSALGLALLTGISLIRMQGAEELHVAAGSARRVRVPQQEAPANVSPKAVLETVKAPLATETASLASTPGPSLEPALATPDPSGAAPSVSTTPGSDPAATSAPPTTPAASDTGGAAPAPTAAEAPLDSTDPDAMNGPLTTMEPLTVFELAPGKSVEIEARTRLSLRVAKEGHAEEEARGASGRTSATKAKSKARATASDDGGAAASKSAASKKSGKAAANQGSSGKDGKHKTERGEARAPNDLMNPWPSP